MLVDALWPSPDAATSPLTQAALSAHWHYARTGVTACKHHALAEHETLGRLVYGPMHIFTFPASGQ